MNKALFVAAMLLGTLSVSAKNVVPVHTSCGKTAYIDTDRTTVENTMNVSTGVPSVLSQALFL